MAMVGTIRSGDNGKVAWRTHPMMGETIIEGAELGQLRARSTPFAFAFKKAANYEKMETVGKVVFEKKDCYKVRFVDKPYPSMKDVDPKETKEIREFFEYYEVESGLLIGTEGVSSSDQGDIPTSTVQTDYKKFGDMLVAAKTVIKAQGMEIQVIVTNMEWNTIEKADMFALPPEIEVLVEVEEEVVEDTGGEDG